MMDCIFCKIIAGDIPSKKVYEDDEVYAFEDIAPQAPVHLLIIPKKHIPTMNDVTEDDGGAIVAIHRAIRHLAVERGLDKQGYRVVNNCGRDGGQVVFHLHYHLMGGEKLGPLNARS